MKSRYQGKTGLRRLWNALFYSLDGRAKDYGSAAVMISLINAPVVWALVILG
jgi:diacylglycerol kinase